MKKGNKKYNKPEKPHSFLIDFSLNTKWESFSAFNALLYKLGPEIHKYWTLYSLQCYVEKIYQVALQLIGGYQQPCMGEDNGYRCFNTGLTDKYNEDIYCFGKEETVGGKVKTVFKGFWTSTDLSEQSIDKGIISKCKSVNVIFQKLINNVRKSIIDEDFKLILPENFDEDFLNIYCEVRKESLMNGRELDGDDERKCFQAKYEELIETRCLEEKDCPEYAYYKDDISWRCFHLIIDGSDNLPKSILRYILGEFQGWSTEMEYLSKEEREKCRRQIQSEIVCGKNTLAICKCIYQMVKDAKTYAEKLSKTYNLIAPYYYIQGDDDNKIGFILPLYLEHLDKPDSALLFDSKGIVRTMINMNEVYIDLRLIGRIDAYSWL